MIIPPLDSDGLAKFISPLLRVFSMKSQKVRSCETFSSAKWRPKRGNMRFIGSVGGRIQCRMIPSCIVMLRQHSVPGIWRKTGDSHRIRQLNGKKGTGYDDRDDDFFGIFLR